MFERPQVRSMTAQVPLRPPEQIEQFRYCVLGFRHQFDQLHEVRSQRHARIIKPQSIEWIVEFHFAKRVQFALPAAAELNLALEEEIEPTGKLAPRLKRPLRHGLQFSVMFGQPRDDEARLRELGLSKENGGGRFQADRNLTSHSERTLELWDSAGSRCRRFRASLRELLLELLGVLRLKHEKDL